MHNLFGTWRLVVLLIALLFLVLWIALRAPSFASKEKRKRFLGRTPLTAEAFYLEYYRDSGISSEIVSQLRTEISEIAGIPAGLLRPGDRFLDELSVAKGWKELDESPDDFFFRNREREKRLGVTIDIGRFKDLNEFIREVGRLEESDRKRQSTA